MDEVITPQDNRSATVNATANAAVNAAVNATAMEYLSTDTTTTSSMMDTAPNNTLFMGNDSVATNMTPVFVVDITSTLSPPQNSSVAAAHLPEENLVFRGNSEIGLPPGSLMRGESSEELAPLGLLVIIILVVLGNFLVMLSVKLEKRLHHMSFYFFVSMATVHIIMAATAMPPAVWMVLAGMYSQIYLVNI